MIQSLSEALGVPDGATTRRILAILARTGTQPRPYTAGVIEHMYDDGEGLHTTAVTQVAQRATCPVCDKDSALMINGRVYFHKWTDPDHKHNGLSYKKCPGSGLSPTAPLPHWAQRARDAREDRS